MLHAEVSGSVGAVWSFQRNVHFERAFILRLKRPGHDHKSAECGDIESIFYCEEVLAHQSREASINVAKARKESEE